MKILVIEDTQQHADDAVAAIKAAGHQVVGPYSDYSAAAQMLQYRDPVPSEEGINFDAVLSDVFFPPDSESPIQPCGIMVAVVCEREKIPFVLVTDQNAHAIDLRLLHLGIRTNELAWKLVGTPPITRDGVWERESHAPMKEWGKAIAILEKQQQS